MGRTNKADDIKFLVEPDLRNELVQMISSASTADLAVAFWGNTAQETLKLKPGSRVICDLMSGGCNPAAITELMKQGIHVKAMDRLHSKVYLAGGTALVGSANASTNGLGEEGRENAGTLEAALLTKAPPTVAEIQTWFDQQWKNAYEIKGRHIGEAKEAYKRSRRSRPNRGEASLLTRLKEDPYWFKDRNIRVLVYENEKMSDDANDTLQHATNNHAIYSGYEDATGWKLPPGEIIIDYSLYDGSIKYSGVYQVLHENPRIPVKESKNNYVTLVRKIEEIGGVSFPPHEVKALGHAIEKYLGQRNWKVDRHYNFIDARLDKLPNALLKALND